MALVLAGVVISVRGAQAGSINLLQAQETWIERDCVAIPERDFVYVICPGRARPDFVFSGGMPLMAALSWSAPAAPSISRHRAIGSWSGGLEALPGFNSGEPAAPWESIDQPFTAAEPPPIGFSDVLPPVPTLFEFDPPIFLDPREWADPPVFVEPPVVIDPVDGTVTPEPSTWVLMGTGLAAAWKAARRKRTRREV